jgi:uncharacterized SAM-binding protein YcdF (DUF218 family)
MSMSLVDLDLVDASAPGLGEADVIFVFGSLHTNAADVAAAHYKRGLSSVVVVTGGESPARAGHHEAEVHRDLLLAYGVPVDAIIVERQSKSTVENVRLALPLIIDRVGNPRTVIAVVKWFHHRALVVLAHHVQSVERIFSSAYEPFDPATGKRLLRSTWRQTSPRSVREETARMRSLIGRGWDPLIRDGHGWVRSIV